MFITEADTVFTTRMVVDKKIQPNLIGLDRIKSSL
ncbi:hypothetical protein ZORO111902_00045 [Zobellia roscoffensis]